MRFFNNLLERLFARKIQTSVLETRNVILNFPGKFNVRIWRGLAQISDPADRHFLLQISTYTSSEINIYNVEKELERELSINPNAVIQTERKYGTVCSAIRTEDGEEIYYTWKIGHQNKRVLASMLITGLKDRNDIERRIRLADEFIDGIEIPDSSNNFPFNN